QYADNPVAHFAAVHPQGPAGSLGVIRAGAAVHIELVAVHVAADLRTLQARAVEGMTGVRAITLDHRRPATLLDQHQVLPGHVEGAQVSLVQPCGLLQRMEGRVASLAHAGSGAVPGAATGSCRAASADSTSGRNSTSGSRTPWVSSSSRTWREAPATITLAPRARCLRTNPWMVVAAVESMTCTREKSSTKKRGRSPMRSSAAPTDAAAPKKNAPVMR